MALKSSNKYPAIIQFFFLALLFIGGTLVFAAHLIFAGDWSSIFSELGLALASFGFFFLLLLCFGMIITLSYFYGLLWRERRLSAAAQGDSRFLTAATNQPDQTLALQPGETVSLVRKRGIRNIFASSLIAFIGALTVAASGEVIVFALLPAFGHSTLNPFYFPLTYGTNPAVSQPTTLDWITAAFPLVLGLLLIMLLPILITEQRHKLIANDQGLTLSRLLRWRQFIPWDDISLFIQPGKSRSGNVTEQYLLWGREHRLAFEIIHLPAAPTSQKTSGAAWTDRLADTYHFEGGFERYAADTRRVLATIAVRSHAPLQVFTTQPALITKIKQRLPDRLTLDDLNAAPLAGSDLQPQPLELAAGAAPTITLKERLPLLPVLLETVLWFVVIGALAFIFGRATFQSSFSELSATLPDYGVIIIVAVLAAFVAVMAFGMVWPRRSRKVPAIIASPDSLIRKTDAKILTITIPWDEVRAWAIKPSPDHTRPQRTYIVCSERATLAWTERPDAALAGKGIQGDRHQAYQEQAEHLHRLIAARTGLPLREINPSQTNPTQG